MEKKLCRQWDRKLFQLRKWTKYHRFSHSHRIAWQMRKGKSSIPQFFDYQLNSTSRDAANVRATRGTEPQTFRSLCTLRMILRVSLAYALAAPFSPDPAPPLSFCTTELPEPPPPAFLLPFLAIATTDTSPRLLAGTGDDLWWSNSLPLLMKFLELPTWRRKGSRRDPAEDEGEDEWWRRVVEGAPRRSLVVSVAIAKLSLQRNWNAAARGMQQ